MEAAGAGFVFGDGELVEDDVGVVSGMAVGADGLAFGARVDGCWGFRVRTKTFRAWQTEMGRSLTICTNPALSQRLELIGERLGPHLRA